MSRRRGAPPPRLRGDRGAARRSSAGKRTAHGNVRAEAAFAVERTLTTLSPVDTFLEPAYARCDPRDHALLTELVLGTLRWLRRLDHVLAAAANRRFDEIEPALRPLLRVAAYQLLMLDRVPDHAVVHEAVEQARHATHRGGASFTNAVLRRLARSGNLEAWAIEEGDPVRRLGIELSHPDLLVRRWLERFGSSRARQLLEASNRTKPLHLLAFRDRGGREALAESLIDEGVEVAPSSLAPLGLTVLQGDALATRAFRSGLAYVQDEASQLAALVPPPRPHERILDVAAAPGGKSFALLSYQPTARCTLADRSLARVVRLRANLARLGRPLPLLLADATALPLREPFDRVVVDLPCSGTGTLRKHPELKWRLSEQELERLSAQGLALTRAAAERVAPGGLLVVITCSLEAEENERMVATLLEGDSRFVPLAADQLESIRCAEATIEDGLWLLPTGGDHDGFTVQVLARRP